MSLGHKGFVEVWSLRDNVTVLGSLALRGFRKDLHDYKPIGNGTLNLYDLRNYEAMDMDPCNYESMGL